jgi:hypothetical protein
VPSLRSTLNFTNRFWAEDAGLTGMLFGVLLTLFVAPSIGFHGVFGPFLLGVFYSLLLVSGFATVTKNRLATRMMLAVGAASIVAHWWQIVRPSRTISFIDSIIGIVIFGMLAVVVLIRVFRPGSITIHRIVGSVVAYLLIGLLWIQAYRVVQLLNPGAFQGLPEGYDRFDAQGPLGYFSFVTLTTLGYGDILPVSPTARSLAVMEALIGQLFPAILIARLVSMEITDRAAKPPQN